MDEKTKEKEPRTSVEEVAIEHEMKTSYLDYSMSVIIGRAIPDIRDGLKPVHRRCLFSMHQTGSHYNQPYKKSARIVGDVMGKYHPHGDAAIYDTIVRMAQDFSLRYPLVDGQGNFGSIDGDPPAAMRYTEARLHKITNEILNDLDKGTVDFVPNYDGSLTEPEILPSLLPMLLLNGTSGIAVGMATSIPPHNLGELIDAFCHFVDNRDVSVAELMKIMPGPDFPTGGFIFGQNMIKAAYETGKGSFVVRAKAVIETDGKGRQKIVITEIPYQTNKSKILENIADLVKNKRVEGISDLRDESDRDGMRIVIEIKKDEIPEVILNSLLQAYPAADQLFHHPAGDRQPAAPAVQPGRILQLLPGPSQGDHPPPLALRTGQGREARAHHRGPEDRPEQARPGHQDHPRLEEPPRGQGRPDRKDQADRGPGRRHPGHAAVPPDRAGDRKTGK